MFLLTTCYNFSPDQVGYVSSHCVSLLTVVLYWVRHMITLALTIWRQYRWGASWHAVRKPVTMSLYSINGKHCHLTCNICLKIPWHGIVSYASYAWWLWAMFHDQCVGRYTIVQWRLLRFLSQVNFYTMLTSRSASSLRELSTSSTLLECIACAWHCHTLLSINWSSHTTNMVRNTGTRRH